MELGGAALTSSCPLNLSFQEHLCSLAKHFEKMPRSVNSSPESDESNFFLPSGGLEI